MYFCIDTIAGHKFQLQIAIFTLALLGFILSIIRLSLPGSIPSRMNVWVLVVCLKSMTIITYEVLTERHFRFQKWRSTKANMILNCVEPVFWLTAFVLSIMGVSRLCVGASCGIGIVLMLVALVLVPSSLCLAVISVREHRGVKSSGRVQLSRKEGV